MTRTNIADKLYDRMRVSFSGNWVDWEELDDTKINTNPLPGTIYLTYPNGDIVRIHVGMLQHGEDEPAE
jgi:hypothetical protein